MSIDVSDHPQPDELQAFLDGRLNGSLQERIEQHVEVCTECCERLRSIPADSLIDRLRAHETLTLVSDSSVAHAPSVQRTSDSGSQTIPEELRNHPRYRITGRLGVGGMGVVYRAEHRLMERPVALKVLSPRLLGNPAAVERFRVEVRAAARLSHPNIVAAWDADEAGGLQMLVMEFIDGISVARQVQKAGPIPLKHACIFARQAALGLQHAMEKGMVHRDIKPQNLMLTRDGSVRILDFGLARFAQERTSAENSAPGHLTGLSTAADCSTPAGLTRDGSALGTPEFMAPEQILNARTADIRADIFSLGCTLFFMLTGHSPFSETAALARLVSPLNRATPNIAAALPGSPPALVSLLQRMLATDPAERPQTPKDVADALEVFSRQNAQQPEPTVRQATPTAAAQRKTRTRHRAGNVVTKSRMALTAMAVLLLTTLTFTLWPNANSKWNNSLPAAIGAGKRILLVLPHEESSAPLLESFRRGAAYFKVQLVVAGFQLQPADLLISRVNSEDFDGVIFLGPPQISAEHRCDPAEMSQLQQLASRMAARSRPVAAIGSGVPLLAELGCLDGRRASRPAQELPDSANIKRVQWIWRAVVVDGPWITSADPTAAKQLLEKVVQATNSDRAG
jgi:serine/threonine protein kinase